MDHSNASIDPELLQDQTAWVRGLARSLALDPSGADDVAQEAMLAALQSPPHEAEDARRLRAWLSRVVFNLSNLRVRRDSRRRSREEWAARPERTSSVAETVERAAQLRIVVDEVMDLAEPYRSTVLMRYFEGLSTQDTADAMDCSPVTVRKRLSRALQKMRTQLDRKHGGDGATWLAALAPLLGDAPLPTAPLATSASHPIGMSVGWASGPILAGLALVVGGSLAGSKLLSQAPELEIAVSAAEPTPLVSAEDVGAVHRRAVPLAPVADGGPGRDSGDRGASEGADRSTRAEWTLEIGPAVPAGAPVTVTGHVFDLDGFPLAGLEVYEEGHESPFDVTAFDGSFHLASTGGEHELTAHSAHYATLRTAVLRDPGADSEPVIIAGPSIDVSGQVADSSGMPLEGVRIELEVGEESTLYDFPHRAQNTRAVARYAHTGSDGSFQLDDWITGPGLALRVSREGYLTARVPVPSVSTAGLQIELATELVHLLQGVVYHRSGEPAAGTRVELAAHVVETDPYGAFALPYGKVGLEEALWISKPGYQSKHIPRFGARIAELDHQLPWLQLVLGGPSRSIVGRVVGPEGDPLAGWEVAALEVAEASGGDESSVAEGPGFHSTETTEGGEFRFNGLGDARYIVQAFDAETLVMVRSEAVEAGSGELELAVPSDALRSVAGRVVARNGAPLTDALVTVVLSVPSHAGMAIREGEYTRTDAHGHFRLNSVPYAYADLRIDHEEVSSVVQSLESVPNPGWVEIEVPRDRFVRFDDGGLGADQIALVDRLGRTLEVRPVFAARTERVRLRAGRSGVLAANEDASELVVYREGREVQRLRLDLREEGVSTVSAAGPSQVQSSAR